MTHTSNLEDELSSLIQKSLLSPDHIHSLAEHFISLTSDNGPAIKEFLPQVKEVTSKWPGNKLAIGLNLLLDSMIQYSQGKYNDGLKNALLASETFIDVDQENLASSALLISGIIYRSLGDFDDAIHILLKGSELVNKNSLLAFNLGGFYYQLAEINVFVNDLEAAEKFYNLALERAKIDKHPVSLFRSYVGLGNLHKILKDFEKAELFLTNAISVSGINDMQRAKALCDLGVIESEKNNLEKAIELLKQSYNVRIQNNQMDAASTSLIFLSETYLKMQDANSAINELSCALEIAQKTKAEAKKAECYQLLWRAYEMNKNWEKAHYAAKNFYSIQSTIQNEKIENVYKVKNAKIEEQRLLLKHKNQEMIESITYAKRIQSAILPSERIWQSGIPNSFVLYKPKDIVAGDFYWMQNLNQNKVLFAACDCTGHGVPGAMVSVICNASLNRSVREFGLIEPAEILNKTRELVIQEFEKSEEDVKDGMDISLVCLQGMGSGKVLFTWAGANNPVWIIKQGTREIEEIKADKQPIGKFEFSSPFTQHARELFSGDIIYVFSDGFADQFGGPQGKKFKYKQFEQLLLSINDKPMQEQSDIINQKFEDWKGDLEQVDDVCVIGIKIETL